MTGIDPGTGMPELPEGFYWRVTGIQMGRYWDVKIKQRRAPWLWPKTIESTVSSGAQTRDKVLSDAWYVLARVQERFGKEWWNNTKHRAPYAGNYPKRTLRAD